jgi:hypothetical protein
MGIFRHDRTPPERAPGRTREDMPCVSVSPWLACDRCRVAQAQVEVVTNAGPVFLCQHHHKEHRDSIIAAGYVIRVWPGAGRCSYSQASLPP